MCGGYASYYRYKHINMNFDSSSQKSHWLKTPNGSLSENESLVVRKLGEKIFEIGQKLNYRKNVILTSISYLRRYYRAEKNILSVDPFLNLVTCIYLAAKVEEEPPPQGYERSQRGINLSLLIKEVKGNLNDRELETFKRKAVENEIYLLSVINFDLLCFHPLKPAVGFLEEVSKTDWFDIGFLSEIKNQVWFNCVHSYLIDELIFEYPPSVLGASSLYVALKSKLTEEICYHEYIPFIYSLLKSENLSQDKIQRAILNSSNVLENGLRQESSEKARIAFENFLKFYQPGNGGMFNN